jgi:putative ABC transport system substrate-binding protein
VLSIGVSFESNAHIAAVYGIEILTNGADAGALKVGLVSPPDIAINFLRAREIGLKIPFRFFESASIVYDRAGRIVRDKGKRVIAAAAAKN